jgi:type I restriction enzyme S subunit
MLLKSGRGIGRPNLNMPAVDAIPIPFPPFEEQLEINRAIDAAYSVMSSLQTECARSMVRSAILRQSILRRAFRGALVPQNLNDEPASELLARIKKRRQGIDAIVAKRGTKRAA